MLPYVHDKRITGMPQNLHNDVLIATSGKGRGKRLEMNGVNIVTDKVSRRVFLSHHRTSLKIARTSSEVLAFE